MKLKRVINYLFFIIFVIFCFQQNLYSQNNKIKKADSLLRLGQVEESRNLYQLQINSTEDSTLLAKSYIGLGKIQLITSEFDSALKNYLRAEAFTETQNTQNLLDIYTGIGVVHSKLKSFEKATYYLKMALNLSKDEDLQSLKVLVNLAGVYVETNNPGALATYKKALQVAITLDRGDIQAVIYTNLSNYYIEKKNWELAQQYAKESLQIRKRLKMQNSVITYNNYGYALVKLGKLQEGINAYKKALPKASLQEKKQVYLNLMNANKEAENYKKALSFYQQYDAIKDSIASKEYREKIAAIQTAYETDKNEKKIERLEIENARKKEEFKRLLIGIILLLALLATTIFLYVKNQRVKQALAKSKLTQRLLQVQLNPHFLFNALQQTQVYIFNNDKEKSMEYLSNFSRLIRLILETSNKEYIPLSEEIEMLKNYLYLQQTAASTRFLYTIDVKTETDSSALLIPVMLLQPFVENAVLHGVKEHPKGKIRLLFKENKQEGKLVVEIVDNGKGFQNSKKLSHQKLHKSMGNNILHERVGEYNKTNSQKIQLEILDFDTTQEFKGTRIVLNIPYQLL